MPKSNILSEQYDDFLNNYAKQDFEKIAQGKSLKVKYIENFHDNTLYSSALSFNTGDKLELFDNGRRILTSEIRGQLPPVDFYNDDTQSEFYRFIVQQFLSGTDRSREKIEDQSDKKVIQFSGTFKVKELIERFRGYKNSPEFSQFSITNITESSPTESTIDETLDFIRGENESINSAIAANGTVSPGNGLMPDQMQKISKEEYLSFVNSTFTKALKGFGNELGLIKISSKHEFATIGGFIIAEANSDSNGRRKILILSTHKQDCGNNAACIKIGSLKLASNSWDILDIKNAFDTYQEIKKLEYRNNEKEYLKSIAKSTFDSIFLKNNNKTGESGVCRFNKKKFIKHIQSSTDNLHSICRTDVTTLPSTAQTISYQNSTNTSITNSSFNTTTSKPEQGDDIDKSHIAVIVGFLSLIIGIGVICTIYYCVNRRTSNKRAESKSVNYRKCEEGKSEQVQDKNGQDAAEPLLNQQSASANGGIVISDKDASIVANAVRESSPPKRTQARIHVATSAVQDNGSQSAQCSRADAATGLQETSLGLSSITSSSSGEVKNRQDWYGQQGEKADETYAELKPAVEKRRPASGERVNPSLEAVQVESPTQQASARS